MASPRMHDELPRRDVFRLRSKAQNGRRHQKEFHNKANISPARGGRGQRARPGRVFMAGRDTGVEFA